MLKIGQFHNTGMIVCIFVIRKNDVLRQEMKFFNENLIKNSGIFYPPRLWLLSVCSSIESE